MGSIQFTFYIYHFFLRIFLEIDLFFGNWLVFRKFTYFPEIDFFSGNIFRKLTYFPDEEFLKMFSDLLEFVSGEGGYEPAFGRYRPWSFRGFFRTFTLHCSVSIGSVLRILIRWIRKILASWIRIRKNMRINGSGSKGQNINQTAKKKSYSQNPNLNY